MMSETSLQYLCIVTYGRSGSTLIQAILNAIDGYCIRGENNLALLPLFWSAIRLADAKVTYSENSQCGNHPWHGIGDVDPERYTRRLIETFRDEVLRPPQGCRVVGFKEIRFFEVENLASFLDFIRTELHPCKLIFNTRDADAVARSAWHADGDPAPIVSMVHRLDQVFHAYRSEHPDDCFVLEYDAYKNDPMALEPLFSFLGEPFDVQAVSNVLMHRLNH
ncbi:sulfotransferase [Thiocapsa roseopersicina]|uniref:Sulfotransferase family protein n=1 Tax=Thiocapsa roseopersicina TaxID=1058 RepID=A0A1H2V1T7_THIRO|nr:sulfotransferase [Thiocapsa roseopersicina]SDW62296.1 Sulfotransferase family protein [Thiocapsa roseopersicina]